MYTILTSRPGQFHTEIGPGVEAVESYDYFSFGRCRARFVIARLDGEPKVRIVDEAPPQVVNLVPAKFLPKFDSVDAAQAELRQLAHHGGDDVRLIRLVDTAAAPAAASARLRITFVTNGGKIVEAPARSNLLRISLREQGGIPFKCGGGLCGTCHCTIESGIENTDEIKPKERKLLSEEALRQGHRLACQTFLNGDVSVSWVPLAQRSAAASARSAS